MFAEGTEGGGKPLPAVSNEMTGDGREVATTAREFGFDPLSPTAESAKGLSVGGGRGALSTSEDRERGRTDPFSFAEPEMTGVGERVEGTDIGVIG